MSPRAAIESVPPEPDDDALPSVHEAWSRVMNDVGPVGKEGWNSQQNYSFRGVDAVVIAVAPALRAHGVSIIPHEIVPTYQNVTSKGGAAMRECTLVVTYRVTGPAGDFFDGKAPAESMDSSDKGTAKAMSVAYRTFLLQALAIPTGDPDPDESSHERAAAPRGVDPMIKAAHDDVNDLFDRIAKIVAGTDGDRHKANLVEWAEGNGVPLQRTPLIEGGPDVRARLAAELQVIETKMAREAAAEAEGRPVADPVTPPAEAARSEFEAADPAGAVADEVAQSDPDAAPPHDADDDPRPASRPPERKPLGSRARQP